jgi:hypothetical protein
MPEERLCAIIWAALKNCRFFVNCPLTGHPFSHTRGKLLHGRSGVGSGLKKVSKTP